MRGDVSSIASSFAAAITIGTIGAAFGSVTAALVQIYTHRRETRAAHRAARLELDFTHTPHCIYAESRLWAALAAGMAFTLGLVLMTGGTQRISASAYSGIASHGGPDLWGGVFIGCAVFTWLCAWRFRRWLDWALIVQALPFAGISVMFGIAAVRFPDANITAAPIYAWIMIMHACLADYARRQY